MTASPVDARAAASPRRWDEVWQRRWPVALSCLALTVAVFVQAPGRIVADSKLDLTQDPVQFLARSMHLWAPQAAFGELQNQAYGYLFPMGPFFALCHGIGVPAWIAQRAWQALLLNVAFLGMRELTRRLGIGTPATRLLGGLAYALCPAILTHVGSISAEILPECVAPWVLVPLIGPGAAARPRRAAMCSGIAILCTGGVNASATLAVLVLPALWLLVSPAGPVRRRLAAWWAGAVVLATLWWAIPLVLLGRYSPPFLNWIESAQTTTATAGVFAALTGTSDWLGHLVAHTGPESPAMWMLVARPVPILCTGALAALGLVGLIVPGVRHRRFLLGGVLLGAALVTFGHEGPGSGLFADAERSLLDGSLEPFRNIWKFDLVLRIPLVIGFVYGVGAAAQHRVRSRLLAIVSVAAVAAVALPVLAGQLESPGSFTRLPGEWTEAASWLSAHDHDGGRALLLPAAQHPDYFWGLPTDEPLQVLATTPWAVRDVVPLGGAGEGRLLDGVDDAIESGRGSPGLARYLTRAGVQWLVVRNDLDRERENNQITAPQVVRAALAASPGITPVASFGPTVAATDLPAIPAKLGDGQLFRGVVIYHVAGPIRTVSAAPLATTLRVSGGPESLLELADAGLLPTGVATVMAADPTVAGEQPGAERAIVTDGYRRQELTFGRASGNESATLMAGQPWSQRRAGHEYDIGDPAGHQTTAVTYGVRALIATSSASEAAAGDVLHTANTPAAGFGADPGAPWMTGAGQAVGQWLQADLIGDPVLRTITIAAPEPRGFGTIASVVAVRTDEGTVLVQLRSDGAPQQVAVAPGPTRSIRVTIRSVHDTKRDSSVPLLIRVPGVTVRRGLLVPDDAAPAAGPPTFVFETESLRAAAGDGLGIDRAFTLGQAARYRLAITASARLGSAVSQPVAQTGGTGTTCGDGPPLTIDGLRVRTIVHRGNAVGGGRLTVTGCGSTGDVFALGAGPHRLVLLDSRSVVADEVTLTPLGLRRPTSLGPARAVTVTHWAADSRAVQIGAGPASWLVVTENANSGWIATLSGHRLTPAIVDGWKQAFVVPAGSGGLIRLHYGPDRIFRGGLLLGGIAALLLIGLAVVPERRRVSEAAEGATATGGARRIGSKLGVGAAVLSLPFIGGTFGIWAMLIVVAVMLGCRLPWPPNPGHASVGLRLVVVAGLIGASVLAALDPYNKHGQGAASRTGSQILTLAVLAALAVRLAMGRDRDVHADR
jgi:arabinofuranan 3-O-arabinosyltransferase